MRKNSVASAEATLTRAGVDPLTRKSVLEFDAIVQAWRRRARKRELGHRAIEEFGLDLDLAHLDVLVAIDAPSNEFADSAEEETKVATVAERLGIDPSRASRMVSELVKKGYVSRQVSQADSRATVLGLTPPGQEIVSTILSHKYLILAEFLSEWTEEELKTFLPLFARFSAWSEQINQTHDPAINAEIEALAKKIAKHRLEPAS
jgi:DNA-binding MarR family transcriptional regulator